MKKRRAFRPDLNERLEDRTVPSGAGGSSGVIHVDFLGGGGGGGTGGITGTGAPTGSGTGSSLGSSGAGGGILGELGGLIGGLEGLIGGFGASLGTKIGDVQTLDIGKTNKAFQAFEQTALKAYQTYISSLKSSSPSSTAAATFNTAINGGITTLTTAVDSAISNLAAANPNLQGSVNTALTGLGTSLTGLTLPTSKGLQAQAKYLSQALKLIGQANTSVNKLIHSAAPPAGEVTLSAYNQAVAGIQGAFQTFNKAYNSAVQASSTNPATNRTAFNTAVGTALTTLNSSIDTALGKALTALPAASLTALEATIQTDLLTPLVATPAIRSHAMPAAPKDLQDTLLGIKSPSSSSKSSLRQFNAQSQGAINSAEGRIVQAVTAAVQKNNGALNGTGGTSMS